MASNSQQIQCNQPLIQSSAVNPLQVASRFTCMVIPASLGLLVGQLINTTNLIFIGHLNDPTKIAAVGMGNMIINMCGNGPFYGLNSGMETLLSQAWGAGRQELCGQYLKRARVVILMAFVPIALIFIMSPIFLRMVGQDEEVIKCTYVYMLFMMPGVLFLGLNDLQRKFLNLVGKQNLPMNTQIFALIFHVAMSYLFVTYFQWGVAGTGFATFLSNLFIFVVNEVKTQAQQDLSELNAVSIFDKNVYRDFGEYLRIGVPNALTIFIEFCSYEILILFSGYLGVIQQATQIILLNLICIPSMLSFAFQQAACAMVGQEIGANNVTRAKKIYKILLVLFVIGDILDWVLLFLYRFQIAGIYTESKTVTKMTNYVIWIVLLATLEFVLKGALLGVIKALEQQKRALYINMFSYISLVIPLAYFCAFKAQSYGFFVDDESSVGKGNVSNNRGVALWMGHVVGIGCQVLGYFYIISSTNWQSIADGAQERQMRTLSNQSEEQKVDNYQQEEIGSTDDYERIE